MLDRRLVICLRKCGILPLYWKLCNNFSCNHHCRFIDFEKLWRVREKDLTFPSRKHYWLFFTSNCTEWISSFYFRPNRFPQNSLNATLVLPEDFAIERCSSTPKLSFSSVQNHRLILFFFRENSPLVLNTPLRIGRFFLLTSSPPRVW